MSRVVHFVLVTPEGRPFLSRMLCDLGADIHAHKGVRTAVSQWEHVTCPECLACGPQTVEAVLGLPDAALVSLGAWTPKNEG